MSEVSVGPQFIATEVDVSNNTVSVYSGRCIVRAIICTVAHSAHTVLVYDGAGAATTLKDTLPASLAIASRIEFFDEFWQNGIYIDPDDAATGTFRIIYAPVT